MKFIITLVAIFFSATNLFAQTEKIEIAGIKFTLPNSEWKRNDNKYDAKNVFCYERTSIQNGKGENVIPNITFIVETGLPEDLDLVLYSSQKRSAHRNLEVQEVFSCNDKPKKIKYKYAIGYKGTYTDKGNREHTVYLIHLINKNIGIEVIMDITSDLFVSYEQEFLSTILSIQAF